MSESKVNVKSESHAERKMRNRRIASGAILTAMAALLMYLEIPLPLMPPFLKFDFSEIPVLIGTFALGPVWGMIIELLKVLLHLPVSQSAGIGELSNFLVGVIFVGTAGLIYRKVRTKRGAAVSMSIATAILAALAIPVNYFVTIPLFLNVLNYSMEDILGLSASINPLVSDERSLLLACFLPFNLFKGIVDSVITFFIYKPISKLINKTYKNTHAEL